MAQQPNPEIGEAIVAFQYVERIKSELIIATKLLDRMTELTGDELSGARKIVSFYFEALQGEINIAHGVTGKTEFDSASAKVKEAGEKAHLEQYEEAVKLTAEAISKIASIGHQTMQKLKNNNLL